MSLRDEITSVLRVNPNKTAREIAAMLNSRGHAVNRSEVNVVLYSYSTLFMKSGAEPPLWSFIGDARVSTAPPAPVVAFGGASGKVSRPSTSISLSAPLYAWQCEALDSWRSAGRRGVIEAVTGTGKTMVGIAAVSDALNRGLVAEVVVPGKELQQQWVKELRTRLPGVIVGLRGDGHSDSFPQRRVIVSIVNTASKWFSGIEEINEGLIVADECHHYGADTHSMALDEAFTERLGLTATYERNDDGIADYLDPYFGGVVFSMGYARAIDDDVTARFKVALVGVKFAPDEKRKYDELSSTIKSTRRTLINAGLPAEPFGEFMKAVSEEAKGGYRCIAARAFLKAFTERRDLLGQAKAKTVAVDAVVEAMKTADRSIVFTESIDRAKAIAERVSNNGLTCESVHSEKDQRERREVLGRFSAGRIKVLAAPRILDEGIDVPAADLAVIVSASRTRRQMIQRMGRVLRKKPDGRLARFVIMYVEGTSEDPALGAHEAFLEEVTEVADEVRQFGTTDHRELTKYLQDMTPREVRTERPATKTGSPGGPSSSARSGARKAQRGNEPSNPTLGSDQRAMSALAAAMPIGPGSQGAEEWLAKFESTVGGTNLSGLRTLVAAALRRGERPVKVGRALIDVAHVPLAAVVTAFAGAGMTGAEVAGALRSLDVGVAEAAECLAEHCATARDNVWLLLRQVGYSRSEIDEARRSGS